MTTTDIRVSQCKAETQPGIAGADPNSPLGQMLYDDQRSLAEGHQNIPASQGCSAGGDQTRNGSAATSRDSTPTEVASLLDPFLRFSKAAA